MDLGDLSAFSVQAVGEVGRRRFQLVCTSGDVTLVVKVEKQQVRVLAEYLERLLADLPGDDVPAGADEPPADDGPDPHWVVGTLGVSYDEVADRIVIVAEELVGEEEEGDVARCTITRPQAKAFAARAAALVAAGRPPCPICGLPLDPAGHECPRTNGHRPPIT